MSRGQSLQTIVIMHMYRFYRPFNITFFLAAQMASLYTDSAPTGTKVNGEKEREEIEMIKIIKKDRG